MPVSDALDEKLELAFDHARILRDAVERVRVDLELRGIATAFVGPTFTLAELRTVYEAVWGVHLDGANFRRSLLSEGGWVIPTDAGPVPGASGGKPAELFRAGQLWEQGGPIRFPQPPEKGRPMRAVVYDRYGPPEVLRVEEVERPVPKPDEVLVRVRASTVTRSDCGYRAAHPFFSRVFTGLRAPRRRIVGTELAGIVEEVGEDVTEFEVGDRVFGLRSGANAELVCVREQGALAHMPAGMSFEDAAALSDGPSIANACLNAAGVREGERVLGVRRLRLDRDRGRAARQGSRRGGHGRVRHAARRPRALARRGRSRRLHAGRLHAKRETLRRRLRRRRQAVVPPLPARTEAGRHVHLDRPRVHVARPRRSPLRRAGSATSGCGCRSPKYTKEDVLLVKRLVEEGRYRPVVDRTYALDDVVEATRYVETGQKTGNVVLTVAEATDGKEK